MKKNTARLSYNIAYCGITIALGLVVMLMAMIPAMTYVVPAISGIIIWTISEQINKKWAILAYVAASLLVFMIIPELESKVYFILFFGYYPVVRDVFEKKLPKGVAYFVKFAVFNAAVILAFNIVAPVIGADRILDGLEFLGDMAVWGFLGMANIAFFCYEICLGTIVFAFRKWLKPRLRKK